MPSADVPSPFLYRWPSCVIIAPPPTPPPPSPPPALPGGCLPGMPAEYAVELEPSSWLALGENQPRPELRFFLGSSSSSMSGW